ncbi:MAG: RNA-guided pseudouridylation complex pseudouridine synthase subunit Cbf5 [Candidatus Thorarchaeota archaeon]|nr:MAG: RNA-guided pseudouridylation complex pseudouridine synthase subunit Cbf5 [Candidatus Thorarchaeota archaeon]RLI59101.1 MAG: RNA-guided pseudouridylation complex pseudouridine synthase subunit Cbf5 [Candidatus Thorarchaeota archaeon]
MAGILPADQPRELIVRTTSATDPDLGFSSLDNLPIEYLLKNGVIVLDKPAGPTSHEVATWVRRIIEADRVGHGGTLDPGVTGILPTGVGNATRAMQALLPAGKEYVCILELHHPVPEEDIRETINEFTGKLYQRPPLRSSVKRVLRVREIYYNEILEIKGRLVLFRVGCQAGTYIRKLCFDLGEALGVGGHMRELRRTRVGPFREDEHMCSLVDLQDAYIFWKEDWDDRLLRRYLLPVEFAMGHLPFLSLRDSAVDAVCHGADLAASGVVNLTSGIKRGDLVVLKTLKGEAIAIARATESSERIAKLNSGIVGKTERVLMERGRYPPMWKKKSD